MIKNFYICISLVFVLFYQEATSKTIRESRAKQHFGVNCLLNRYLEHEFELAIEYLNASIYMRHDTVALHGFGKMFNKFWLDQIENVDKITSYVVKRGGVIETPGFKRKNDLNSFNYFANESLIIHKFLNLEKKLNKHLLTLHEATSSNQTEVDCVTKYNIRKKGFYPLPEDIDPFSSNFLDENFLHNKIEKIKFMADLQRKINRFDLHTKENNTMNHHFNYLGIHILDKQLQEQF